MISQPTLSEIEEEVYSTSELLSENTEKEHITLSYSNYELRLRCRAIVERIVLSECLPKSVAYTDFWRGNKIKAA